VKNYAGLIMLQLSLALGRCLDGSPQLWCDLPWEFWLPGQVDEQPEPGTEWDLLLIHDQPQERLHKCCEL